jgi:AcrR family transcriptional regulator
MPPTPADRDRSTRERLLDAAYELLIEDGVESPTIQNVARRAGLSNGAVYANFATRDELLLGVALGCWSRLPGAQPARPAMGVNLADESEPELLDIDQLVAVLAEHHSARPGPEHRLLAEVTGTAMRDADTERVLRAGLDRLSSVAAGSMERAKGGGTIDRRLSTDVRVALIVDLYMGAVVSKALNRRPAPEAEVLAVLRKLLASDMA